MKTLHYTVIAGLFLSSIAVHAEQVPESVHRLLPTIQSWGSDPELVAAVKAQNSRGLTLEAIREIDRAWMATEGMSAQMKAVMSNPAAEVLRKLEGSAPYFLELFAMDNQGANVAMTNKTSDYWQGDEAKFTKSYNDGIGDVHFGEVEFDPSAQAYLVQVSVPVLDGGAAIGALTVGVNLDELEK